MKITKTQYNKYRIELLKDVNDANKAIIKVILSEFGKDNVVGIYFKGSASKEWKSPIDYVPEISDIDIHFLLKDDTIYEKKLSTIEGALKFSQKCEEAFFKINKKPKHVPQLQIQNLSKLKKEAEYLPSLSSFVKVLYGKPYEGYDSKVHATDFKSRAKKQIIENESSLQNLRMRGFYKYNQYLVKFVHDLSWRISSSGPNFLCLNGYSYEDAWFLTRTDLVKKLKKLGYNKLAKYYSNYYLNCWHYFLKKDTKYARLAIINGYHALEIMVEEAKNNK